MPDPDVLEELASLYVLGQLSPRERAEFETRLAASPTLRAFVHELEVSCECLAQSAPAARPPRRVWEQIAARTGGLANVPAAAVAPKATTPTAPTPASPPVSPAPSAAPTVIDWIGILGQWFGRAGWAVAALLAILWLGQDFRSHRRGTEPLEFAGNEGTTESAAAAGQREASGDRSLRRGLSRDVTATTTAEPVSVTPPTERGPVLGREETRRLQMRVQELASQLADVNHALTQRQVLPPGSGRFQVFRLSPTNRVGTFPGPTESLVASENSPQRTGTSSPTSPESAVMEELLARALARQLASASPTPTSGTPSTSTTDSSSPNPTGSSSTATGSANNSSTTTGTGTTTTTEIASIAKGGTDSGAGLGASATEGAGTSGVTFDVLDLHPGALVADNTGAPTAPSSLVANRASQAVPGPTGASAEAISLAAESQSALGFYSSDTGRGSIALVTGHALPEGLTYQVWATDAQGGTAISLGTTGSSAGALLLNFNLDPGLISSPAFLITVEPTGGSTAPLGPVVVRPPTAPAIP